MMKGVVATTSSAKSKFPSMKADITPFLKTPVPSQSRSVPSPTGPPSGKRLRLDKTAGVNQTEELVENSSETNMLV